MDFQFLIVPYTLQQCNDSFHKQFESLESNEWSSLMSIPYEVGWLLRHTTGAVGKAANLMQDHAKLLEYQDPVVHRFTAYLNIRIPDKALDSRLIDWLELLICSRHDYEYAMIVR